MRFTEIPFDENGVPFSKPAFRIDIEEYRKITSEINSVYNVKFKNKLLCAHTFFGIDGIAYVYWFENHGFNNYNIYLRVIDKH